MVCRVDFAQDIQVGEGKVTQMIKALSRVIIPRYKRCAIDDQTVYFEPKSRNKIIRIYSKFDEVKSKKLDSNECDKALGIVRIEHSFKTLKAVTQLKEKLKLPNREANVILTPKVAIRVLQDTTQLLQLNNLHTAEFNQFELLEFLNNKLGSKKVMKVFGFISFLTFYGKNFYLLQEIGVSKQSYYSHLAKPSIINATLCCGNAHNDFRF